MNVFELAEEMSLKKINISDGTKKISGGFAGDLLSHVLSGGFKGCAWATVMTNINVIAVAWRLDMACVIICDGMSVEDEVLLSAKEHGVNILSSDESLYEVCGKMKKAGI